MDMDMQIEDDLKTASPSKRPAPLDFEKQPQETPFTPPKKRKAIDRDYSAFPFLQKCMDLSTSRDSDPNSDPRSPRTPFTEYIKSQSQSGPTSPDPFSDEKTSPTPDPFFNSDERMSSPPDPLFNEPIFRSGRRAYQHPFASARQTGDPLGAELVAAAKYVLKHLDLPYAELEKELLVILTEGWLSEEWAWLRVDGEINPDRRACTLYKLLWDTGFFDQVVDLEKKSDDQRRALGHFYGVVTKTLEQKSSIWIGVDESTLSAILEQIVGLPEEDVKAAVSDVMTVRLALPESREAVRLDLLPKWQRKGWEHGCWMGEIWSEGASMETIHMIAKVINVRFVGSERDKWAFENSFQAELHFLRLLLGGGRFSLEEWAPILLLLKSRSLDIVRDTLRQISECRDLVAIRRRWGDIIEASKAFRSDRHVFAPVLLKWITLNNTDADFLLRELRQESIETLPRGLILRMISHRLGQGMSEEIDGAYWSELIRGGGPERQARLTARARDMIAWRSRWCTSMSEIQDFIQHFGLDLNDVLSLRTSFAVRSERWVWSGPVRTVADRSGC